MRKIIGSSIAASALAAPLIAQAQSLNSAIGLVNSMINVAIGLLIGVAIIAFFWGLIRYLFGQGKAESEKKTNVKMMIWGILAIAVMLSVYGLVRLLQNTFGLQNQSSIAPPNIGEFKVKSGI